MANDCLVTKYKGAVQNNNLPYYSGIVFENKGTQMTTITCPHATAKVISGNVYLDSAKTQPVSTRKLGNDDCLYMDVASKVLLTSKYDPLITQVGNKGNYSPQGSAFLDASQINYSKLRNIYGSNFATEGLVDLSTLSELRIIAFNNTSNNASFVIPEGTINSTIQQVQITKFAPNSQNIECNLSVFNKGTSLTRLNLQDEISVSGDVNTMLDAMVTKGRTSGTLVLNLGGTSCTYTPAGGTQKVLTHADGETNGWKITVTFTGSGWTAVQGN